MQTFPANDLPYIASSAQSPHSPHTLEESPSTDEYDQPVCYTQVSRTLAYPSILLGKVCLNTPALQDSGYGGDISVSRQRGILFGKRRAQITSFPRIYSTPHITAFSFTHGQSPWNSALRVIRGT